ncbi:S-layer protein [Halovivax sp.]|uniref:S-layer protein n=1 Tax=Halovivax sp. TaxID=1935978 RepID=UPI0025BFF1E7|nr:S-layer protein [Halovivax sp.]
MVRRSTSRRRFGFGIATGAAVALAGCIGGDDDADDGADDDGDDDGVSGDEFDYGQGEDYTLTVELENEDGDPVSDGIEGSVAPIDFTAATYNFDPAIIEDGVVEDEFEEGDWEITVVSLEDEFDDVEAEVSLDDDTEVTITLEGAPSDEEREEAEDDDEEDDEE